MTPERWQRLEDLFHDALERRPVDRPAFLRDACRDDPEMRAEVERLLLAERRASRFVDGVAVRVERVASTILSEGQQIGGYRIVREVGRGGVSTVYHAERADSRFEMRVAIKLITRGLDADAALHRFRHERHVLIGLDHPNIGRLLDAGISEHGLPYFVTEYVDGLPIDEYCREQRLPIARRLDLFGQVCSAVTYAHQHLVGHRSLKPSNVLVTRDGVPKVLDFGVARLLDVADFGATVATEFGASAIAPQYASPEQLGGERVTTASDVYALGVLLRELLAGMHDDASVDALPEPGGRVRHDLDTIMTTAMQKDPRARYSSVALMELELASWMVEETWRS